MVVEDLETGKRRARWRIVLPVDGRLVSAGLGVTDLGGLWTSLGIALANLFVVLADFGDIGFLEPGESSLPATPTARDASVT